MALDEVMPEARQTVIGKRAGGEIMSEDKEQKIEVNLEELDTGRSRTTTKHSVEQRCIR